jgi:hypothetical protein
VSPAAQAQAIASFLLSIGITVETRALASSTFLPGVAIEGGRIVYDPDRIEWAGDLLHEAGHLAVTPAALRPMLGGTGETEPAPHAGEAEATAWAYAAVKALDLDPAVLFHAGGYHGKSQALIRTYGFGSYPGLAGLAAAGMALGPREAAARGMPAYPALLRWLRD